ncbi:MAG: sigma-70 family RNA polymerase sigma factor [Steroidobacteraceae bacterium]
MSDKPGQVDPTAHGRDSKRSGSPATREVTRLLAAWGQGDRAALDKLTRLVYEELRRLAHRYMAGQRSDHTLQTTALLNEAYLRLAGQDKPRFADRSHFLAVAAKAMRQILVDHAKAALREKRGAGAKAVELDEAAVLSPEPTREILDLNEALEKLATVDARKANVVELSYFGGLKQEEIAEVLNVSVATVRRDWTFSRAWLYAELRGAE